MLCYQFVARNFHQGDKILLQKISTDWCSSGGHFAILRDNQVYEYVPGVGMRKLSSNKYWQETDGIKIVGYHKIFKVISVKDFMGMMKGKVL